MTVNDATLRQIEAADPTLNTWLSANAGSGKTRVLTDRVARLLLAGVSPQNILCLTYTKAAASEMQNRLFRRLGDWAMKPDGALRAELAELGVTELGDLAQARRLFAGAIETPGGLKIQTIHSFCAAILRRFPLEAGVAPDFTEMDDRTARILQAEVLDAMAEGPQRPLVEGIATVLSGVDFADLLREIVARREAFIPAASEAAVKRWFGLAPEAGEADVPAACFDGGEAALLARVIPVLQGQSATMQALAGLLAGLDLRAPTRAEAEALFGAFLYRKEGKTRAEAKFGSVPTKKAQEALGADLAPFQAFMQRVAEARELELRLEAARKTWALHRFAVPFIEAYEQRKQMRGWLDFDDLIQRAGQLLSDPGLAAWVLYRLDGGIDHILVDEAQDTSPGQWRVIALLAREFTAGESARSERARTIFVVGDLKQSIYSFQGADPGEFTRMKESFSEAFAAVDRAVIPLRLEYSFRSSVAILQVVDHTLEAAPGLGAEVKHIAFDHRRPGRVDLWPVVERPAAAPEKAWNDPVDAPAPEDAPVVLADAVADAIAGMLRGGSLPSRQGGMRRVRPGDVMVLVQRRSELFHLIIRACKARGIAVAGADRLRIGGELAVKDLTATLAFLATPEDDLSLAAALRSPLFGLSEDALYRLAQGRGPRYLWSVLREAAEHADVVAVLSALRDEADYLRPYDLIERILTRHEGRRRLVARLGPEAEDGIDALLAQALAYERLEAPSLTGFLTWLAAEEVEIKRQMDSAGDQVRVMTVHGAKGLESPVVILPDTAKPRPGRQRALLPLADGLAWRVGADFAPAPMRDRLEAERVRAWEERMRLLYVAMTRAESWLIVAAAGDVGAEGEPESWYRMAEAGLRRAGPVVQPFALGEGLRFETGDWSTPARDEAPHETAPPERLPAWASARAIHPEAPPAPLVPSRLGGEKILAGAPTDPEQAEAALRHGRQVHRLLEFLPAYPRADWPALARDLLAFGEDGLPGEAADALLDELRPALEDPDLAWLFSADGLAEVEISAPVPLGGGARVHGVIDRLVVEPDRVLAVDFKTNRDVPDAPEHVPEGILRQLGAYEAALAAVYPGRRIESAVLWTRAARLMRLPPGLALRAFGRLDATGPRP